MNTVLEQIWGNKGMFFIMFFLVFSLSYITLMAIDFLPEAPATEVMPVESGANDAGTEYMSSSDSEGEPADATVETDQSYELTVAVVDERALPVSMYIPKLDREISVLNPASRTIAGLDEALLYGVVRHPDSATLTQEGTVFILGHSSYLPAVLNKNFQAFNGIQNLAWGDIIEVSSETAVYEYRVEKVYRANAQEVTVPIAGNGHTLTIATCNSFGSADDRYIVEASRISVRAV